MAVASVVGTVVSVEDSLYDSDGNDGNDGAKGKDGMPVQQRPPTPFPSLEIGGPFSCNDRASLARTDSLARMARTGKALRP